MLSYSVPLILTDIGWWVNNSFDRYIVIGFCGTMANGLLAVAYKIPAILNVFQGIFIQAWQISAVKEIDNEENNNFYNQSYVYMNMVICIMCAGLILLSKQIAYVLYAKDFLMHGNMCHFFSSVVCLMLLLDILDHFLQQKRTLFLWRSLLFMELWLILYWI